MDFYLPGMIHIDGKTGKYPAISLTGHTCSLSCQHCKGALLKNMIPVQDGQELVATIKNLEKMGMKGVLISGGCNVTGELPWRKFLPHLKSLKTSLFVSAHAGFNVNKETALAFKETPVQQVLIDFTIDKGVLREVFRLRDTHIVFETLDNLFSFGPTVIPHVIIGLDKGRIKSEYQTLEYLAQYDPELLVLIVIMPINPLFSPPPLEEVINVFREARKKFRKISLGCARPRGRYRYELEEKLIEEKLIDRMALWSDRALRKAKERYSEINFHYTCCSVSP